MHLSFWAYFHIFGHGHQTKSALQHAKEAVPFEKNPFLWVSQLLEML